jgi:type VII secretion protein EccB
VPSRQDQLHSYQYSLQRVVAALVTHDPDPARSPLRRAGMTALVSLVIASVALVGVAVWGLLTGQSDVKVRDSSVVFQEKGTGARFVFLDSDNRLHPVINYTSGLLLSSGGTPNLESASADKLAEVDLGVPLGIEGAPDSLPSSKDLLTASWSACTTVTTDRNGTTESTLVVGQPLTDGTIPAQTGKGLLVQDAGGGTTWLIYGNRKFQIPDPVDVTKRVLGWAEQQAWTMSQAWINAVPSGPDLKAPPVAAADGTSFQGLPVGELVTDGNNQFGVMFPDGFSAVTPMQARLLQVAGLGAPAKVNNFATIPPSKKRVSDAGNPAGLPTVVPDLVATTPQRACMTAPADGSGAGVRLDPTLPQNPTAVTGGDVSTGEVKADLVSVKRGKGVVVTSQASPTASSTSGAVGIVTDTGRLYTLADRSLLTKLGYGNVTPQQVPSTLLSLLPDGPALSADGARKTHPNG